MKNIQRINNNLSGQTKKIIFGLFSFFFFQLIPTLSVFAIEYVKLEPNAFPGVNTSSGKGLADFLGQVFNFGIAAAVVLALIMIIWGGIMYMTTDAWEGKDEAKTKITDALYGLGLALVSYLILYTLNPCLVVWTNKDGCAANTLLNPPPPIAGNSLTRDSALSPLISVVSSKGCYTKDAGCTDTVDLPSNAIAGLNNLANIAGSVNVVVTGGAEDGHQTHGIGIPNVDLRYNPAVVNGLTSMGMPESSDKATSGTFICEIGATTKVDCSTCQSGACHIHVSFK